MPSRSPIIVPSIATDDDLVAAPISAAWLVEGRPTTRSRRVRFMDGAALSATIWETTAGRFDWHYGPDELVHILEGEVELTVDEDQPITLRRGDVVFFPGDQIIRWYVRDYVKKLAINGVRTPLWRRVATRIPFARHLVRRLRVMRG